jgi:ABC-type Zn2+ transport system substrate-binding protein/surface adhesin
MTVKDAVEASALFAKESKIGMAVQKAYTTVMGTSTGAMKAFKIALISTGIGAIVIAIGLLIANFDKVKTAVMNLIPGLKAVGDFFGKIIDNVTDFVGVTSDATREMDKLNKATEQMLISNKDLLASFGDQLSEFQKKQVEIANGLAERIKEINERKDIDDKQRAKLVKEAQERAKRELLKNIDDTNEAARKKEQEENDKKNEEYQKSLEDAENKRKEEYDNEVAQIKKINDLKAQLAKEDLDRQKSDQEALNEYEDEQFQLDLDREDERLKKEFENIQKEKAAEETLRNMKVSIRENTAGLILNIAKKGSAVSKAIQIAEIIREQVKSGSQSFSAMTAANAKAIAASPLTAGQPFVTINTAQVLSGIALSAVGAGKAIKDIMSESKTPSSFAGASSGSSGGGGSAPAAPSFNLVQGTGSNQIAQGLGQQQRPIQAYVVSNNVTTAQALDRNIIAGASL